MKKRSNKSFLASAAYLVVALVLCAGVIFYTGNGGTGLTAVSYTHLDVYKRQRFISNIRHLWISRCP